MAYNHILFLSRNKTKRFNQSSASPKGALCPFADMLRGRIFYPHLKSKAKTNVLSSNH